MNLIQDQEILISVNGIVKQFFFSPALPDDASAILSLYRSHIGREFCAWTDDYPSADTIRFDLARNSLLCLKTKTGHDLAGVISFDADPETDILDCWSKELVPSVEFARVAVSLNYQGCGIAGKLFTCAMEEAKGVVFVPPIISSQRRTKRRSARTESCSFPWSENVYIMVWITGAVKKNFP